MSKEIHTHNGHCDCGHHHEEHTHCGCGHHHEHGHHHEEHSGCSCCNQEFHVKKEKIKKGDYSRPLIEIGLGIGLFLCVILFQNEWKIAAVIGCLIAYVILGNEILINALRSVVKGHVLDENFLMAIATLAALAIGEYTEAIGVLLFYRVGELFEEYAVARSRNQISEAIDMRPEVVNLVQGSEVIVISPDTAKVGDVLLVRPGDRIPLDGIVVQGESRVDTSTVTGESVPVKVAEGAEVISGCINLSGAIQIRVEKCLEDSMVTRILNSVESAAASKPKVDRFISRFAKVYTPFVVVLALVTAIVPSIVTGDWKFWLYTAITFLVISCPCALVLSVPLSFYSGIGAASKKGILFKGGYAIEALKNVKAVVLDKTGTVTKGTFEVVKCIPYGNLSEQELLSFAASCELNSTHPIGDSIVQAAKEQSLDLQQPTTVEELSGKGICATIAGETVLCGNRALLETFGVDCSAFQNDNFGTEVLVAVNGVYSGYLVISDVLKEEAKEAISALKKQGLKTVMLTGDVAQSAEKVAEETGIEEYYANLFPEDKFNKLQEIRQQYGDVLFVGDGINDAPVLAGANVGAAMGSGADAAMEAADLVFMTSSVQAIPETIALANATCAISMQNIIFALAVKGIVMILGLLGFANMWLAVFADTGVAMLCVLNAIRILYRK